MPDSVLNNDHLKNLFLNNELGSKLNLDDIEETFEFLDDWEDRYAFVIDLGKKLADFPEEQKTDINKVHGCQSQVWLIQYYQKEENRLFMMLESDALIVRGLAAIVLAVFNGKTLSEINAINIEDVFAKLDLIRHISATRGNGLRSMVKRIQDSAKALSKA